MLRVINNVSASLDLILIPTARELGLCEQDLLRWLDADRARIAICGWGVVAAGLRTMQLLAEVRPRQVWLLGSAGAYSSALPVGQAFEFSHIALHGLGVGAGANWLSPVALAGGVVWRLGSPPRPCHWPRRPSLGGNCSAFVPRRSAEERGKSCFIFPRHWPRI